MNYYITSPEILALRSAAEQHGASYGEIEIGCSHCQIILVGGLPYHANDCPNKTAEPPVSYAELGTAIHKYFEELLES